MTVSPNIDEDGSVGGAESQVRHLYYLTLDVLGASKIHDFPETLQ